MTSPRSSGTVFGRTHESALGLIGNTPLLALRHLCAGPGLVLAKAEHFQPTGSVKDRVALRIVQDAYADGMLAAGQTVVEMTSGNTGAGLAAVCGLYGNPFCAVMSAGNSPQRARMMQALGAEVELVPQVDGSPGQVTGADIGAAEARARSICKQRGGFFADQFHNESNLLAHEQGTGPEIWSASEGRVQAFVAAVGTGGTFVGTARYLKSRNADIVCAAVEPAGARVLAGERVESPRHLLQGAGYGRVVPLWQPGLASVYLSVSDEEAIAYRGLLARREGLHVGFTSAANVCAAVKLLRSGQLSSGAIVVTVLCDTGLKYDT